MTEYPRMFRVRQRLERTVLSDVVGEVDRALEQLQLHHQLQPGQTVAVTAGSRGIANISTILRTVVRHVKQCGAEPFLVPAMGSHGGATAAGQLAVLERLGITESACECPIRASMETVVVCQAREGFPVHFDRMAFEADHVVVCGRVKPHTRFVGDIESGLMKMLLIGLGKHAGAIVYHQAIHDYSFGQIVRSVAREVLTRCKIVAGLAIVENAHDETARIVGVAPCDFEEQERRLLQLARQWLPKLPFDRADLLMMDEIGKDISGAGLDTNVVGRKYLDHAPREDEFPKIKYLVARGLSEGSGGNATGLGLVELCRSSLLRTMDVQATRTNCLTGSHITAAMLPLDYETDREILDVVLAVNGLTPPQDARVMWIENTLRISEVECSAAYLAEARTRSDLEILTQPRKLPLGADGNLPAMTDFV